MAGFRNFQTASSQRGASRAWKDAHVRVTRFSVPGTASQSWSPGLSSIMTLSQTDAPEHVSCASQEVACLPSSGSLPSDSNAPVEEATCRICWSGELSPHDPLLQPCKCSGSVRFVHKQCNQLWMSSSKRAYCEVCKARMLPLWQARRMSALSFLSSLLLPLQFCMFGVLVAILPALLGLFTVQLFLPVRNLDAEAGHLHQAVPLRSVLILTHALEHFTLFKCVGDFVLLSGNTVWQIVTLYNQQLSYREVLTRLVAHNTFQIVWDLSGRSSLRALQFLGACMCFLLFPGLAARLMAAVAGPIAGLYVYKWGFVAELGLGCVYCCNKLRQRGQP